MNNNGNEVKHMEDGCNDALGKQALPVPGEIRHRTMGVGRENRLDERFTIMTDKIYVRPHFRFSCKSAHGCSYLIEVVGG